MEDSIDFFSTPEPGIKLGYIEAGIEIICGEISII